MRSFAEKVDRMDETEKAQLSVRLQAFTGTSQKQSNLRRCASCGKKLTYTADGLINHKCSERHERGKQVANRCAETGEY